MQKKEILLTTTHQVPGKSVNEILGIVYGNTVRARHIGRDFMAGLKNIVGGEIKSYTELLAEARKEATKRIAEEGKKLKADAIVSIRYTTNELTQGAVEVLAYGTAVRLK